MRAFRVEGLARQYGSRWALREASFDVRAGEILGVIGPNGSGKTTLFGCVAGTIPASAGVVHASDGVLDVAHRKHALFYVPENARPWPDQSAAWVLAFIGEMFGRSVAERREVTRDLALDACIAAPMRTLSKGEHRRVLIALGLLTSPPALLLDEPFDGLDLRQTRDAMAVLRKEAVKGRALVISVHQLADAARLCDRLVLLSDGRVVGDGTLDELRLKSGVGSGGIEEVFLALT